MQSKSNIVTANRQMVGFIMQICFGVNNVYYRIYIIDVTDILFSLHFAIVGNLYRLIISQMDVRKINNS